MAEDRGVAMKRERPSVGPLAIALADTVEAALGGFQGDQGSPWRCPWMPTPTPPSPPSSATADHEHDLHLSLDLDLSEHRLRHPDDGNCDPHHTSQAQIKTLQEAKNAYSLIDDGLSAHSDRERIDESLFEQILEAVNAGIKPGGLPIQLFTMPQLPRTPLGQTITALIPGWTGAMPPAFAAYENKARRVRKPGPHRARIPRPANSFMLYRQILQPIILALNPGRDSKDASKIIAELWRSEDAVSKLFYKQLSEVNRRQHRIKYPSYKFLPRRHAHHHEHAAPSSPPTPTPFASTSALCDARARMDMSEAQAARSAETHYDMPRLAQAPNSTSAILPSTLSSLPPLQAAATTLTGMSESWMGVTASLEPPSMLPTPSPSSYPTYPMLSPYPVHSTAFLAPSALAFTPLTSCVDHASQAAPLVAGAPPSPTSPPFLHLAAPHAVAAWMGPPLVSTASLLSNRPHSAASRSGHAPPTGPSPILQSLVFGQESPFLAALEPSFHDLALSLDDVSLAVAPSLTSAVSSASASTLFPPFSAVTAAPKSPGPNKSMSAAGMAFPYALAADTAVLSHDRMTTVRPLKAAEATTTAVPASPLNPLSGIRTMSLMDGNAQHAQPAAHRLGPTATLSSPLVLPSAGSIRTDLPFDLGFDWSMDAGIRELQLVLALGNELTMDLTSLPAWTVAGPLTASSPDPRRCG